MAAVYLPGEVIPISSAAGETKIIGYGIDKRKQGFTASQPGLLRSTEGKTWLSVQSKRYVPQVGDRVLGVVNSKQGDLFKIDIGTADLANVSFLNFEGATKRNRPNLKTGDVLFARITQASKHLEPELSCIDELNRAKGMGVISSINGLFFKVPLHLARRLLSPSCQLLKLLGKDFKFEITIGLNGRVWINGPESNEVMAIRRILLDAEFVLESEVPEFVEREIRKFKGFLDVKMETN